MSGSCILYISIREWVRLIIYTVTFSAGTERSHTSYGFDTSRQSVETRICAENSGNTNVQIRVTLMCITIFIMPFSFYSSGKGWQTYFIYILWRFLLERESRWREKVPTLWCPLLLCPILSFIFSTDDKLHVYVYTPTYNMIIGLCLSCTALSLALFRDFVVHSYTVLFSCVQNIPHFNIGGGTGFCKTDTRLSQVSCHKILWIHP